MPVAIIGAIVSAGVGYAAGTTILGLTLLESFFARPVNFSMSPVRA